jgi:hypothetical protein
LNVEVISSEHLNDGGHGMMVVNGVKKQEAKTRFQEEKALQITTIPSTHGNVAAYNEAMYKT